MVGINLQALEGLIPGAPLWLTCIIIFLPTLPGFWAIWHSTTRRFATVQEQIAWIGLSMLVPVIGGLVYILFGRKRALPPLPLKDKTANR